MRTWFILICLVLAVSPAYAQNLKANNDPDAIASVAPTIGDKDIAEAWLILPTQRYPHYVRGQEFEPAGLRLRLLSGEVLTLTLDENLVFEDRSARLADLDGDGRDEIILVLTSIQKGAALVAYSVEDGQIALKAQTPFIGLPFRWLNPAGIADYNGDGVLDVALVQKPHLTKRLEFWTLEGGAFNRLGSVDNISNHQNGSPFTDLAASADFDGDGTTDLAILSGDYRTLRLIKFSNGRPIEFATFPLPSTGNRNFILRQNLLQVPMSNGNNFEFSF